MSFCKAWGGISCYRDLYDDDVEEQVYISRIVQDNLTRIPETQG